MLKDTERKKQLIKERMKCLEDMENLANLYEELGEDSHSIIEDIIKTIGRISILVKNEIIRLK